jgi:hypothetical protein
MPVIELPAVDGKISDDDMKLLKNKKIVKWRTFSNSVVVEYEEVAETTTKPKKKKKGK